MTIYCYESLSEVIFLPLGLFNSIKSHSAEPWYTSRCFSWFWCIC